MKSSNKPLATRSLVLFCMLGVGVCANADPFSFTAADTPLNIPSSGTMGEAVSTISVPPGSSPGGITDLNVYVDLHHSFSGDLDIFLKHVESGTEIQLFAQRFSSGADIREVRFDDEGVNGSIASATAPFGPGAFVPVELLNAFDGEPLEGTWQLRIVDGFEEDFGTLYAFVIEGDTLNVSAPDTADSDNDGVMDDDDLCPGTVIPESVPTRHLNPNRFALVDGDLKFDTPAVAGNASRGSFGTGDTAGCSCEQIIGLMGLGYGHEKFGCTSDVMKEWIKANAL